LDNADFSLLPAVSNPAIELAVEVVVPGIPGILAYLLPETLSEADVGYQVELMARTRKASGYVVRVIRDKEEIKSLSGKYKLRPVLSGKPVFSPDQLSLFEWISTYYGYPLAETIECSVPRLSEAKRRNSSKTTSEKKLTSKIPEQLTAAQAVAVEILEGALSKATYATHLLFGVTGSGKTEVYLRVLQKIAESKQGAIVIVPEIALTPQLIDYFEARLHSEIALLHSELTPKARQMTWERILKGELKIVLGARSAIFAPVRDLKLIIADEEHEASFKQSDTLRYNARDVATVLAKQRNCLAVLGSATPSFETLMNVKKGAFKLIELKERANQKPLPQIEIVNLAKIKRSEMPSESISPILHAALSEVFKSGEQAILLYNRRGFASYLQCDSCQHVVLCPNCSVSLTYHRGQEQLLCHYCGLRQFPPTKCPSCLDPRLVQIEDADEAGDKGKLSLRGSGTERVIDEIKLLFPDLPLLQMDRDSVDSKDSYREILSAMKSEKAQLLVGTQMIAKGHDIPGVTLVGVIDADVGLYSPDFRSSERALQLITQAAGRAGRGDKAGRVIIQTRQPNHPAIVAASTGRFMAFARYELDQRKQLFYPPFGRLMRIIVSSPESELAAGTGIKLSKEIQNWIPEIIQQQGAGITISTLGPAPAPHERLRGRFRFHLLIKSSSAKALSTIAKHIQESRGELLKGKDVRIAVDIDPMDML